MDFVHYLPHVNAGLNSVATVLLVCGFFLVKSGRIQAHKTVMISCFGVSVLFLASYLTYHFNVPSKPFPKEVYPTASYFYYPILLTHVLLAITVPPLAIASIYFGLKDLVGKHKWLVRFTFPIWLYVSVTGVVIYLFLYVFCTTAENI